MKVDIALPLLDHKRIKEDKAKAVRKKFIRFFLFLGIVAVVPCTVVVLKVYQKKRGPKFWEASILSPSMQAVQGDTFLLSAPVTPTLKLFSYSAKEVVAPKVKDSVRMVLLDTAPKPKFIVMTDLVKARSLPEVKVKAKEREPILMRAELVRPRVTTVSVREEVKSLPSSVREVREEVLMPVVSTPTLLPTREKKEDTEQNLPACPKKYEGQYVDSFIRNVPANGPSDMVESRPGILLILAGSRVGMIEVIDTKIDTIYFYSSDTLKLKKLTRPPKAFQFVSVDGKPRIQKVCEIRAGN